MPTPDDQDNIENVILEHGKSLAEQPSAASSSKELESRLDKIEVLIEEMGQTVALTTNFNDYVTDLRGDLKAVRRTRFWMIIVSLFFIFGVDASVFYLMFHHGAWFWLQDSYFKSVVFVSSLTASVVLLSIMIKGAFHSLADRAKDDMVPPHLREGMDALKMLLEK
jgi:hypothetical protein